MTPDADTTLGLPAPAPLSVILLAFALIHEELIHKDEGQATGTGSNSRPFNPLGTGVLIFCMGAGLSFIFGPVGLVLMLGGLMFVVWGAIISWIKG